MTSESRGYPRARRAFAWHCHPPVLELRVAEGGAKDYTADITFPRSRML